jgi:flagellar basal-body rod protein FlgG
MQNGYYAATAGMVTQFNRLDNITNNLANVNTNGYKQQKFIIGDYVRLYEEKRDDLPLENHTKEGSSFLHRNLARVPQVVEAYTNFNMGGMQRTDNTFDLAIKEDDIFFGVQTPQGVRFTRDGSFSLNDQGELVTKEGYPVLASDFQDNNTNIKIPLNATTTTINSNGVLSVNGAITRSLLIAKPENLRNLKHESDNLYIPDITDDFKSYNKSDVVAQGFVEKSNVNAVREMVGLIETSRLVEMYQKVMDTQMNDLNRDAITKIAAKG